MEELTTTMSQSSTSFFRRINVPLRVGLIFALAGVTLAIIGIIRGNVPLNPISIILALGISGLSWGVVSWAVATAVMDVEGDIAAGETDE
jgi:hypothetical protein